MVILNNFSLPSSAADLDLPPNEPLFILFTASKDPITKQAWCPDVRASQSILDAALGGANGPAAAVVEVGQRPEWRKPDNAFRTRWNVHNIPTLARYEKKNGDIQEVGRLTESEVLDGKRLKDLLKI